MDLLLHLQLIIPHFLMQVRHESTQKPNCQQCRIGRVIDGHSGCGHTSLESNVSRVDDKWRMTRKNWIETAEMSTPG